MEEPVVESHFFQNPSKYVNDAPSFDTKSRVNGEKMYQNDLVSVTDENTESTYPLINLYRSSCFGFYK